MLVAPLYARHKGGQRKVDEDEWSIPWILRFCYLIRALKYIFPLLLALVGLIDFFVTWKYCSFLPLFWSSVFTSEIKSCLVVFFLYIIIYFIIIVFDCAPIIISGKDPKIKCLLFLIVFSILFCISPFLLYTIFAVIFSFQTWTIESPDYIHIKWIYSNIVQYLQNDINAISKKYFRIARDRPLRIYIIMFKALIMWLNIQLFQFLITDYPRYCKEWNDMRQKMEFEEKQRIQSKQQFVANCGGVNNGGCCGGNRAYNDDEKDVFEEDSDSKIEEYYTSYSPRAISKSTSSGNSGNSGCCDFNFNKNDITNNILYDSHRLDRYYSWCNERYFKSLRSPLAIIHEIVRSYPETQIDYVNIYNLSQRHLYRYSNETFDKASSTKHSIYAYAAIMLYVWTAIHTVLFWVCYHFGFRHDSDGNILSYIYLIEYIILYCIYGMIIFNVLHCDRLLAIIQNTSWFDDKLRDIINNSLIGDNNNNNNNDMEHDMNELIMNGLSSFHIHHKRVVQITVQHYMMLHVLYLILQRWWLSELVIEYLYGFHAFCDGDEQINVLIKNIIHGRNHNEWGLNQIVVNDVDEWSLSKSETEEHASNNNRNLDINNLDDLEIPTDKGLMGISNRIINTPKMEDEQKGNLLNDFMEEKYVENRRTDSDGMCICHEDDKGFIRMWDELNLDVIRLQYDAFKKGKQCIDEYENVIKYQHIKTTKSMQFYFDFIRSLHYDKYDDVDDDNDD